MADKEFAIKSKREKLIVFIRQGYWYILALFAALIVIYFLFFIIYPEPIRNLFCKIDPTGNFGISFSASLLEDLFFFLTLGILGSLIPIMILKAPNEESYDIRVRALMNNPSLSNNEKLVDFFKHSLKKSIAFVKELKITYIIKDYDEAQNAYKIFTEFDFTLVNMCSDVEYDATPQLPNVRINPDLKVGDEYGHISYLGTYDPQTNTRIKTVIDEDQLIDHHVFKSDQEYTQTLPMQIPPKGELAWRIRYTLWSKIGELSDLDEWHYYEAIRYVNKVRVQVTNHCEKLANLRFTAKKLKYEGNLRTLLAEDSLIEYNVLKPITQDAFELYPDDRIETYFFKPKDE